MLFNFLKRAQPQPPATAAAPSAAAAAAPHPAHADVSPASLAALDDVAPRSVTFLASPDTAPNRDRVHALLAATAARTPEGIAAVLVHDFSTENLSVLLLPPDAARRLADGVADAIEMLSFTLPAAFDSDSHRVAALALEEEVRSAHDAAIDALKRRALAANIGLVPVPAGYALAPLHDGRIVAAGVFKALPDGLKTEVDAKLAAFESELSATLANRATLQQSYAKRRRDLDRDTAGLAVRAALANIKATPESAAYLDKLSADLIRNAALFLPAPAAPSAPRAPIEIASDPRLARYRVALISPAGAASRPIHPLALDRAALIGEMSAAPGSNPNPASVIPGTMPRAGSGLVVIDAATLLNDPAAWSLIRSALAAGAAAPAIAGRRRSASLTLELPISCRVVVTGSLDQYRALVAADPGAARLVQLSVVPDPGTDAAPRPALVSVVAAAA